MFWIQKSSWIGKVWQLCGQREPSPNVNKLNSILKDWRISLSFSQQTGIHGNLQHCPVVIIYNQEHRDSCGTAADHGIVLAMAINPGRLISLGHPPPVGTRDRTGNTGSDIEDCSLHIGGNLGYQDTQHCQPEEQNRLSAIHIPRKTIKEQPSADI